MAVHVDCAWLDQGVACVGGELGRLTNLVGKQGQVIDRGAGDADWLDTGVGGGGDQGEGKTTAGLYGSAEDIGVCKVHYC